MSFIDLFKSRESKEKLSHLKNLVAVAAADGKLEENEMLKTLNARNCNSEKAINEHLKELIKLDISRGEKDNITALLSRVQAKKRMWERLR